MTSLDTSIEAVRRVMQDLSTHALGYALSDKCPIDELMHALTTMKLVEQERLAEHASNGATPPASPGSVSAPAWSRCAGPS